MTQPEPPIVWTGDLNDDCTAHWCGLELRAEQMTWRYWWWAVSTPSIHIATSSSARSGQQARAAAEAVARAWIARKHHPLKAPRRLAGTTRPIMVEGGLYLSAAASRWWMRGTIPTTDRQRRRRGKKRK